MKAALRFLVCVFVPAVSVVGCSTTKLIIKPDQSDAALVALNPSTGEPGREIGKGEVALSDENLRSGGFVLKKDGFEQVYVYVPQASGENQLSIKMQPYDREVAKKLAQAQAELENLRKTLALEIEKGKNAAAAAERVLEYSARAQHFITLGSGQSAQSVLDQVEAEAKGGDLPGYVYLLRAKIKLLAGDKAAALSNLDEALRKRGTLPEAQRLRDALQK
jgi:hypothetical protein